jgi:hypothetical protein
LIWLNEIWRDRSCSVSLGGLTNQDKKERSSIRGAHKEAFQEMSLEMAAQGCLIDAR